MISVLTRQEKYVVHEWGSLGVEEHYVSKEGECTCGGSYAEQCDHVKAVADYIKRGGQKATVRNRHILDVYLPEVCPICSGKIIVDKPYRCRRWFWTCSSSKAHFWKWLGNGKARGFLTTDRPNKLGAYYQQSWEDKLSNSVDEEMHTYFKEA